MANSPVSLKLLIDTQAKRVLFAEASKDSVDFLFHLLSLPLATVIGLLKNQGMVGSLANLYESIENLNETYIQPNKNKDAILKPVPLAGGSSVPLLMLDDAPSEKKFYRCDGCLYKRVSDDPRSVCSNCSQKMTIAVQYVAPPSEQWASNEGGFVKGLVSYMVTDNLVVKPMSTISSIMLLNKFNVEDVSLLEEKVVNFGMDEAMSLLKTSWQSQNVLTEVFLKGN